MVTNRRTWYVDFEQRFKSAFDAVFEVKLRHGWRVEVDERAWLVVLRRSDGPAETVTMTLPRNYLLFRPGAVAMNLATRLRERAVELTERRAAPHSPGGCTGI